MIKRMHLGLDLCFDEMEGLLGILLCYKKEKAWSNLCLKNFITNQQDDHRDWQQGRNDSQQGRAYNAQNQEYQSTIKSGAIFDFDGCAYKVLNEYDPSSSVGECVVTSSVDVDHIINSTMIFNYNDIHWHVCEMMQSMFGYLNSK